MRRRNREQKVNSGNVHHRHHDHAGDVDDDAEEDHSEHLYRHQQKHHDGHRDSGGDRVLRSHSVDAQSQHSAHDHADTDTVSGYAQNDAQPSSASSPWQSGLPKSWHQHQHQQHAHHGRGHPAGPAVDGHHHERHDRHGDAAYDDDIDEMEDYYSYAIPIDDFVAHPGFSLAGAQQQQHRDHRGDAVHDRDDGHRGRDHHRHHDVPHRVRSESSDDIAYSPFVVRTEADDDDDDYHRHGDANANGKGVDDDHDKDDDAAVNDAVHLPDHALVSDDDDDADGDDDDVNVIYKDYEDDHDDDERDETHGAAYAYASASSLPSSSQRSTSASSTFASSVAWH